MDGVGSAICKSSRCDETTAPIGRRRCGQCAATIKREGRGEGGRRKVAIDKISRFRARYRRRSLRSRGNTRRMVAKSYLARLCNRGARPSATRWINAVRTRSGRGGKRESARERESERKTERASEREGKRAGRREARTRRHSGSVRAGRRRAISLRYQRVRIEEADERDYAAARPG